MKHKSLKKSRIVFGFLITVFAFAHCQVPSESKSPSHHQSEKVILPGSYDVQSYADRFKENRVGLVVNHSSMVDGIHLLDTLLSLNVDVRAVFSPEHGFKGNVHDGGRIDDDSLHAVSIPVFSLYGKNKKPTSAQLKELDVLVFDIQDVGVRFYTYLSTLHYVMEAAAESDIPVIVLDRPNPNAHYIDGPLLDTTFRSFIGMHPVPVVHGLTIGEYARMINGEGWLKGGLQCELHVVECQNYYRGDRYDLPVPPSPNLPNTRAILMYPSLCFFEGTSISIGRGTDFPFQVYGHPEFTSDFSFVPQPNTGSKHPKHQGKSCFGYDLREEVIDDLYDRSHLNLTYLLEAYKLLGDSTAFFNRPEYFDKLAGSDQLRTQIMNGLDEAAIRKTWADDLTAFLRISKQYYLYDERQF